MEPKKKLDNLFRQGFSGLEMDPGADSWSAIEERMQRRERRRKMALWRWSPTAAAIVVAFLGGYFWNSQSVSHDGHILPVEEPFNVPGREQALPSLPLTNTDKDGSDQDSRRSPESSNAVNHNAGESQKDPMKNPRAGKEAFARYYKDDNPSHKDFRYAQPLLLTSLPQPSVESGFPSLPVSHEKLNSSRHTEVTGLSSTYLPTNEELQSSFDQDKAGRGFSVGIAASPTLPFSQVNISDHSDIVGVNAENDQVSPGYTVGLEMAFRTRSRWAIEAGLFVNQWVQSNNRLVANPPTNVVTSANTRLRTNNSTSSIQFGPVNQGVQENFARADNQLLLVPVLYEDYTFLELPVGVSYYLADRQHWAWRIKGGLCPRVLIASRVQLDYRDGRSESVDNLPLKDLILNFLLASGVEYRLNSKLHLNIMPALQYGLTPVNQHDVADTYFHQFLIYSGLSYKL